MKILIIILLSILPVLAEVGKITFVKGGVSLVRDGKPSPAVVGMELKKKDSISTKKNSLVKLIFADKSYISIGSKSDFSIEDYFFDKTEGSLAKFKVKKGVFRTITGKIAKISPDRFKLKTKTVTIGIRGTIFSGFIEGGKEEIFCEKGAISVANAKGYIVNVNKGYKTSISKRGMPSTPKPYKASDLEKINSQITGFKNKKCKTK